MNDFCGPQGSIADGPRRVAAETPDQVAMLFYGQALSYGDFVAGFEAMARWLICEAGLAPGDRVAIDLQNSPNYVLAYYAVLAAGGVVVPLNPMYRPAEVAHILRDAGAGIAFVAPDLTDRFEGWDGAEDLRLVLADYRAYLPENPDPRLPPFLTAAPPALTDARYTLWADVAGYAGSCSLPAVADARAVPSALPYTSGSTGQPKGCLHTHASVIHTAALQVEWYSFNRQSVVSAVQPLFHVAGMQSTMNGALMAGATMLLMARWDGALAADLFAAHGCTHWIAPPTMVVDMLGRDLPNVGEAMAKVRCVTGGGSAMPEAVAAQLRARWSLDYVEGYGMTETMSPTHLNPMNSPKRGSIGVVVDRTLSLVIDPDTLLPVADGEVGEIVVAGPQIMQGYWNRPEADAEAFVTIRGTRYLRTGDLGRCDAEGRFYLVDRLKRMINASGFKVWPGELERLIYAHPMVANCAVISAPDPYRGETVKVVIQPKIGIAPDARELTEWLRPQIAAYKLPRLIEFRDSLPMTASHKVDWRALQDAEAGALL